MFRVPLRLTAPAMLALALAGCAGPFGASRRGGPIDRCENVVAEGVGSRRAQALYNADAGVHHQLADARGNLLAAGLRRIRIVDRNSRCRPHSLGLGLIKCTASARVCGR